MGDTLDDQCMAAAYRAREFHNAIRPVLLASKAVADAYAFKDRVKSYSAVKEKVLRKRTQRRADYAPSQVKDASGFRIVCLFNADIPRALDDLLSMLEAEAGKKSLLNLDCVAEIEVHSNRREGDPLSIAAAVRTVVEGRGLSDKLAKPLPSKVNFSSYSSVHVVLEATMDEEQVGFAVASEIQLRSVFEEAWSEISHRLGYGPDKRAVASAVDDPPMAGLPRWKLHLDALKSLADGCAQYSDLIAAEAGDRPPPADRGLKPRSVDPSGGGWRGFYRGVPRALLARLTSAFNARDEAEALARAEGGDKATPAFLKAGELFELILEGLEEGPKATNVTDRQINGVRAETAYCLMHTGSEELLFRAERLWREVLEFDPDFVAALQRLGQLRYRRGDLEEALALLLRAERKAREDNDGDEQSQRRLWVILRDVGLVYWRMAERPLLTKAEVIENLQNAARYAELAFTQAEDDSRKRIGGGNAVYCLAELHKIDVDRRPDFEERAQTILAFLRSRPEYGDWANETAWSTMRLDSVLRAEQRFGDFTAVFAVANEIIRRMDAKLDDKGAVLQSEAFNKLSADERDIYLTALRARDSPLLRPASAANASKGYPRDERR